MKGFIVVLAVVVVFTERCGRARSEDACIRKRFFVKKAQDAVLIHHVIAGHQVTSEIDCAHRCMREYRCMSFNYEDHSTSLPHVCEINDETKQNNLENFIGMDGFSYFELEQPHLCGSGPCYNAGKCLEQCDGPPKCICAKGYTGAHCENELSNSTVSNVPASCADNPCKNNATCANTTDGYNCSCRDGFHGKICENAESCLVLKLAGENSESLHQIHLTNIGSVQVLCDQQTDEGGWTIIQRRTSPFTLSFDRDWVEYENGFKNPQGEFWLGNKIIHELMKTARTLRIELKTRENKAGFAKYSHVTVDGPNHKYRMKILGYSGNIPDCGSDSSWQSFTTKDSDNDAEPSKNCAVDNNAGWWYKTCGQCGNLNRQTGPKWESWPYIPSDAIVFSEIKIR
ncbi:hypothetical protein ACROYT_G041074 [Oculina patagonica]